MWDVRVRESVLDLFEIRYDSGRLAHDVWESFIRSWFLETLQDSVRLVWDSLRPCHPWGVLLISLNITLYGNCPLAFPVYQRLPWPFNLVCFSYLEHRRVRYNFSIHPHLNKYTILQRMGRISKCSKTFCQIIIKIRISTGLAQSAINPSQISLYTVLSVCNYFVKETVVRSRGLWCKLRQTV